MHNIEYYRVLSPNSRGTRCPLRGSCHRITQTCSRRFAVAAPQTRLHATPLRQGSMRHHPRRCNGSPARAPLGSKQVALRSAMRKGTRLGASGVGGCKTSPFAPPAVLYLLRLYNTAMDWNGIETILLDLDGTLLDRA